MESRECSNCKQRAKQYNNNNNNNNNNDNDIICIALYTKVLKRFAERKGKIE